MFSIKDSTHFKQRLAETVAWCCNRVKVSDPKSSLRYDSLYPNNLSETRVDAVHGVLIYRAELLQQQGIKLQTKDHDPRLGRLLCYFPDGSLADGAAEVESEGFFDADNIPPWDTWIGLYRSDNRDVSYQVCLISYVPEAFLRVAGRGIEANPEQCIMWLDDSETPISNLLRKEKMQF